MRATTISASSRSSAQRTKPPDHKHKRAKASSMPPAPAYVLRVVDPVVPAGRAPVVAEPHANSSQSDASQIFDDPDYLIFGPGWD
jgi:hypothetical protein